MEKRLIKKILKELNKYEEYYYPTVGEYSLFILPNGKMVGTDKLLDHQPILEKILKKKIISNQEFFNILTDIQVIKIIINGTRLYVNINVPVTTEQKYTLQGLGMCNKYNIRVEPIYEYVPDAPNDNYCRHLLKLPLY